MVTSKCVRIAKGTQKKAWTESAINSLVNGKTRGWKNLTWWPKPSPLRFRGTLRFSETRDGIFLHSTPCFSETLCLDMLNMIPTPEAETASCKESLNSLSRPRHHKSHGHTQQPRIWVIYGSSWENVLICFNQVWLSSGWVLAVELPNLPRPHEVETFTHLSFFFHARLPELPLLRHGCRSKGCGFFGSFGSLQFAEESQSCWMLFNTPTVQTMSVAFAHILEMLSDGFFLGLLDGSCQLSKAKHD